jgi:hypothetical protein
MNHAAALSAKRVARVVLRMTPILGMGAPVVLFRIED